MLLPADRDRGGLVDDRAALLQRGAQRPPPLLGIALVVGRHRVRRLAAGDHLAGRGIDDQRLRGLRRAVHAYDERTFRCSHVASSSLRLLGAY
ncbi:hypothetical protein GCM10010420_32850 [Streptomyces glaucosporus]|uniref:Uncharacterized protein n=1 Tax=Streptomyces glaucosporus TaxID=284044 RepID=A0ABN3IF17_9ACTN